MLIINRQRLLKREHMLKMVSVNMPREHSFWPKSWNMCSDKYTSIFESSQIQFLELRLYDKIQVA